MPMLLEGRGEPGFSSWVRAVEMLLFGDSG